MSATLPSGSTISYSGIIGPGLTLPVALTGTMFYLTVATAPLFIRPSGISPWSQFQPGTGTETPAQFSQLEIYNGTANFVTFQVVAGFAPFIDHRLVPNQQVVNVIVPTSLVLVASDGTNSYFASLLSDKSGGPVLDANGVTWNAVQRQSITLQISPMIDDVTYYGASMSLFASGTPTTEQGYAEGYPVVAISTAATGPCVTETLPIAGPYYVQLTSKEGADPFYVCACFEIYSAVAPGYAGNPPS
jgi:hypothetical protein